MIRPLESASRLIVLVALLLLPQSTLQAQPESFDNEPINYQTADVDDDVSKLIARMQSGDFELEFEKPHGYLKSLLTELRIPTSSQGLVFSKTSLQLHKISPDLPRAIYFNDNVYVGYVQNGGTIEIGATDPKQGAIFYSLKQEEVEEPSILRDQAQCMVCHASSRTQNVPGYLIRSVYPNRSGHPNYGNGTYTTDQTSPFKERWGGWYVTGTHGAMRHMGNQTFARNDRGDLEKGANQKTLEDLVSTKPYLSDHSDIVALMVLEHQTQMHNAITFANFETRQALHQNRTMNKILERAPDHVSETTQRRINAAAETVVKHLLMCDEFQLTDPVAGTSSFAEDFENQGNRDSKHRSLRDLDLQTRLFKYPCSYLIYSPSFDGLPDDVRKPIVTRLLEVLEGQDNTKDFSHLSPESRSAILQILRETWPGLAQE